MGGAGAGKTRAYFSLADLSQKSGSPATFYVVDTDYAVEHTLAVGFPHLENVVYQTVGDWDEYMGAVTGFQPKIRSGDWLICDLLSNAWEAVQDDYAYKVFGMSMASYFEERKKQAKRAADEGWEGSADWNIIKPKYREFVLRFFFRHPGHVLATTGTQALRREGAWKDAGETIATFDHIGFRPTGEKRTAHQAHTVLLMKQTAKGGWEWSTGKDRERPYKANVGLGDQEHPGSWAKSYCLGVAGWSLR